MTQEEWSIQVVVRATAEEVEAIGARIGEVICVPADHNGPCSTPWVKVTSLIDDHDEPRRTALRSLLDDE